MRDAALDRLRGVAMVLMIVDHLLAWVNVGFCLRMTITRASLPLFMVVAGNLMAGRLFPSWRRAVELVFSAAVATWLVQGLPFMAPLDVLVSFCLTLLAWPAARLMPWLSLVVCVVVMGLVHVSGGYSPVELLALMLVGALALDVGSPLYRWGGALPAAFGTLGQWPLTAYVGHLVVMRLAVLFMDA